MPNRIPVSVAAAFMGTVFAGSALAQDQNLERLLEFQTTGAPLEMQYVDQKGANAEQIRRNLQQVNLPQGFKIDLYAVVPDARHMAVGRNVGAVWVGTRKTDVYVVTDRDKDRVADEVKVYAPSIAKKVPNGVCMSPDGVLYIAEQNRVLGFGAAEFFYEGPDVAVEVVVPQGELIPVDEESFNHGARVCRIGPDNKLYVALGQPYNVPPPEKLDKYAEWGIGGIIRMNRDGSEREVYATGIRNSVGMDFNPANGELWFTDNQVDGMGDDIPPGELNRVTAQGQHFGFPWYGGGEVRTNEYKDSQPPADVVFPEVEMDAHAADLGMIFYTGRQFPEEYRNGILSAQHGSWNRTTPVGARVMFTKVNEDGSAGETEVFADGWLVEETGEYLGRPVDVAQLPDGSVLISDDLAGAIYRISYDRQGADVATAASPGTRQTAADAPEAGTFEPGEVAISAEGIVGVPVVDADGNVLGEVAEVLPAEGGREVGRFVIELEGGKRVAIDALQSQAEIGDNVVRLADMTMDDLAALEPYEGAAGAASAEVPTEGSGPAQQ